MPDHSAKQATGRWRRWTFRLWIGLTVVFAIYVLAGIVLPDDPRVRQFLVAIPVPFIMIVLLFLGLGWLAWLFTARRGKT